MEPGQSGFTDLGGNFKEFDACVDVAFRRSRCDAPPVAGLAVWFNDFQNMAAVLSTPAGVMFSIRSSKGRTLVASPRVRSMRSRAAMARQHASCHVKGQNVTLDADDTRVGAFRGSPEDG